MLNISIQRKCLTATTGIQYSRSVGCSKKSKEFLFLKIHLLRDYNFLEQMFSVKSIELSVDVSSLKQMQHSKREK